MKNASLLLAFCVLFGFSAMSQSTTTVEKNTNRITITTKKVDENGKVTTETWIAEGDEPSAILKEMTVNPEVIQKIEIENEVEIENGTDENTIFFFRSAGDNTIVEGKLDENVKVEGDHEVIVIRSFNGDEPAKVAWEKSYRTPKAYSYFHTGGGGKANCAAMGVYVGGYEESGGARVSGLIENGGAAEAGIQEGDIIVKVDEYEVTDFPTLYEALSHFRPGDKVSVRYMRDGETIKTKVLLKDWAELPGHEFRSRDDCGKPELPIDMTDDGTPDDPSSLPNVQTLQLEDVRIYPNPSDGKFSLSFTAEPGPLTVSVADASGKVVFRDDNDNTSGSYLREINITDLPQGYYIIYVKQDDKYFTQQISKQ